MGERFSERRQPAWKRFRQLNFADTLWKWKWNEGGFAGDLKPYCPKCNLQLTQVDGYYSFGGESTNAYYICTDCGAKMPPIPPGEIRKRIARKVEELEG